MSTPFDFLGTNSSAIPDATDEKPLPETSPPEASQWEGFISHVDQFYANGSLTRDPYGDRLRESADTLRRAYPDDERLAALPQWGADKSQSSWDRMASDPSASIPSLASYGITNGDLEKLLRDYQPQIETLKKTGQQVRTADEARSAALEELNAIEARAARASNLGGHAADFVAPLTDPVTVAAFSAFGPSAEATIWARAAQMGALNAGISAASQLAITRPRDKSLGIEWSPADAAKEVAMAGLAGAGMELGIAGLAAGYRATIGPSVAAARFAMVGPREAAARFLAERGALRQGLERGIDWRDMVHLDLLSDRYWQYSHNPMPDLPAAAQLHADALEAALRAVTEVPVRGATAGSGGRPQGFLEALDERVAIAERQHASLIGQLEEATAAEEAQAGGRASNFAFNVARPGLRERLGIDVGAERITSPDGDTGVRLTVGPHSLELWDSRTHAANRAKLDGFTDRLGVDRIGLSKRERLAASVERLQAEIGPAKTRLENLRIEASRRVGDRVGNPGGKPFKQRREAAAWAQRNKITDYQVVPHGRGFVVELLPTAEQAAEAAPFDFVPLGDRTPMSDAGVARIRKQIENAHPGMPPEFYDAYTQVARAGYESLAKSLGMHPDQYAESIWLRHSKPEDIGATALLQAEKLVADLVSGKVARVAGGANSQSGDDEESKAVLAVARWLTGWTKDRAIVARDVQDRIGTKDMTANDRKAVVNAIYQHTLKELKAWNSIRNVEKSLEKEFGGYVGFYDADIPLKANPILQQWARDNHGRELTNAEVQLFHFVAALASPQRTPLTDSHAGLMIFDRFLRSGVLSPEGPNLQFVWRMVNGKKEPTEIPRYTDAGERGVSKITTAYEHGALAKFQSIYEANGRDLEKTMDWLMSRHSYTELAEAAGLRPKGAGKIPEKWKGRDILATHENLTVDNGGFGIFAIAGPKLGSYYLNRVGNFSTVTKDMWYARTMTRWLGESLVNSKNTGAMKEPWKITEEGVAWRQIADEAWSKVGKKLGLEPAIVQQQMWDFEKFLWWRLGGDSADSGAWASLGVEKGAVDLFREGSLTSQGPEMDALIMGKALRDLEEFDQGIAAAREVAEAKGKVFRETKADAARRAELVDFIERRKRIMGEPGPRPDVEGMNVLSPSEVDGEGLTPEQIDLTLGDHPDAGKQGEAGKAAKEWERPWRERMEADDLLAATISRISNGRVKIERRFRGAGGWADGAEPITWHHWSFARGMGVAEKLSWLDYYGARSAVQQNQKAFASMVLLSDAEAVAAEQAGLKAGHLFQFTVTGTDKWAVRKRLLAAGIEYHTLAQVEGDVRVLLVDDGGTSEAIQQFIEGAGDVAGHQHNWIAGGIRDGGNDRSAAVAQHKAFADSWEQGAVGSGTLAGGENPPRPEVSWDDQDWRAVHSAASGEVGAQPLFQRGRPRVPGETPLYSNTLQALESWQAKGTPDQLRAHLARIAGTKSESDWLGLDEFLADKKTVTREEVAAFLERTKPIIIESGLEKPVPPVEIPLGSYTRNKVGSGIVTHRFLWEQARGNIREEILNSDGSVGRTNIVATGVDDTSMAREVILRGPGGAGQNHPTFKLEEYSGPVLYRSRLLSQYEKWQVPGPSTNYREILFHLDPNGEVQFTAPHFGGGSGKDKNLLLHVLTSERIDASGRRLLFIDELQSDWHQMGKKEGYGQSGGAPDAPLKGDAWPRFALRRMMLLAAEEGYDGVAWSTGEMINGKYDGNALRLKRIELDSESESLIGYTTDGKRFEIDVMDGVNTSEMVDWDRFNSGSRAVRIEELAPLVGGDDVAARLIDAPKTKSPDGTDVHFLDFGSKGHAVGDPRGVGNARFYDEILPSVVNGIGKRDGIRSETTRIDAGGGQTRMADAHMVGIPQELRAKFSDQGFPMWQHQGRSEFTPGEPAPGTIYRGAMERLGHMRRVIHILKDANESTAFHETMHAWRTDLPEADLRILEEWAGVKAGKWEVAHDEMVADAWVKYLSEGKAPTSALQAVFDHLKKWLLALRDAAFGDHPDVEITDAVRGVFDRLLGKGIPEESTPLAGMTTREEPAAAFIKRLEGATDDPTKAAVTAARKALEESGNPDLTVAEAIDHWRAQADGTGRVAGDSIEDSAATPTDPPAASAAPEKASLGQAKVATTPGAESASAGPTLAPEVLDRMLPAMDDGGTVLRSTDGNFTEVPLRDVLAKMDRNVEAFRSLRNCLLE